QRHPAAALSHLPDAVRGCKRSRRLAHSTDASITRPITSFLVSEDRRTLGRTARRQLGFRHRSVASVPDLLPGLYPDGDSVHHTVVGWLGVSAKMGRAADGNARALVVLERARAGVGLFDPSGPATVSGRGGGVDRLAHVRAWWLAKCVEAHDSIHDHRQRSAAALDDRKLPAAWRHHFSAAHGASHVRAG